MISEDQQDTELKALYNAYWQGLRTLIRSSEDLDLCDIERISSNHDINVWKGVMANRKKVAEKAFALEIAESRLFYLNKEKKL